MSMNLRWVAVVNILLLVLYGLYPSRLSWYVFGLPLAITLMYFLVGQGTKLARAVALLAAAAIGAYLGYISWRQGYRLTPLLIIAFAFLRTVKLDRNLVKSPDLAKAYALVELGAYSLVAASGWFIGLANEMAAIWTGVMVLAARELTEPDLVKFFKTGKRART